MSWTEKRKSIYIVRHGETDYNVSRTATGQINCPINANGMSQAQQLANIFNVLPALPSHVVHSGLLRAEQTARILNQKLQLSISEEPRIQEIMYGDWQGMPFDHIRIEQEKPHDGAPNGEGYRAFEERVVAGIRSIAFSYELPLIVCHGGVIKALFGSLCYAIPRPANAMLYRVTADFSTFNASDILYEILSYEDHRIRVEQLPLTQMKQPGLY